MYNYIMFFEFEVWVCFVMTNCFIRGCLELRKVNFEKTFNSIFKLLIELVWKFFQGVIKNW